MYVLIHIVNVEELERPRYDGESIVNIPNSILRIFGIPVRFKSLKKEIYSQIQTEKILLILIDGLRLDIVREVLSEHEDLKKLYKNMYIITSTFPSTTPTALVSISMGQPPGIHGILGTVIYVREVGLIINTLNLSPHFRSEERDSLFRMGIDLTKILPTEYTIFEELSENGVRSLTLIPKGLRSGISRIIYRGSEIQEYAYLTEAIIEGLRFLEMNDRALVYIYNPAPDEIAHKRGVDSEHYRETVVEMFRLIMKCIEKRVRVPITLILTTDHGLINTDERDYIEMNKFEKLISRLAAPPYGESRASFLITREELENCEDLNYILDNGFILIRKNDKMMIDLLGCDDITKAKNVGDYLLVSTSSKCLRYSYNLQEREREVLHAMHGSITPEELNIPLIILNF